jgi:hypothetical protein
MAISYEYLYVAFMHPVLVNSIPEGITSKEIQMLPPPQPTMLPPTIMRFPPQTNLHTLIIPTQPPFTIPCPLRLQHNIFQII